MEVSEVLSARGDAYSNSFDSLFILSNGAKHSSCLLWCCFLPLNEKTRSGRPNGNSHYNCPFCEFKKCFDLNLKIRLYDTPEQVYERVWKSRCWLSFRLSLEFFWNESKFWHPVIFRSFFDNLHEEVVVWIRSLIDFRCNFIFKCIVLMCSDGSFVHVRSEPVMSGVSSHKIE